MGKITKGTRKLMKKNTPSFGSNSSKHLKDYLFENIDINIERIKKETGKSADITIRTINLGGEKRARAAIVYTQGLIDTKNLNEVLSSLLNDEKNSSIQKALQHFPNVLNDIKENVIVIGSIKESSNYEELFTDLFSGNAILLVDGLNRALSIAIEGGETRAVEEPQSQTVVKGPRDGFTENLITNTSLLRRRIKSPDLWVDKVQVGRITKTNVAIAYIKGIVNNKVVDEVHERLDMIDTDSILESGNIEELIQDETFTPFPTVYNSERPDAVAASLLEGRVAIIVDGSPFVMIVPCLLNDFFQSSEDYYQRADIATVLRLLRFFCFFLALLAPSLYIAILSFHQEMVPSQLLISIAAQREGPSLKITVSKLESPFPRVRKSMMP